MTHIHSMPKYALPVIYSFDVSFTYLSTYLTTHQKTHSFTNPSIYPINRYNGINKLQQPIYPLHPLNPILSIQSIHLLIQHPSNPSMQRSKWASQMFPQHVSILVKCASQLYQTIYKYINSKICHESIIDHILSHYQHHDHYYHH